jgi:predicted nucleotidyltransferase
VAGDTVAKANEGATGKVKRRIVRDCLTGETAVPRPTAGCRSGWPFRLLPTPSGEGSDRQPRRARSLAHEDQPRSSAACEAARAGARGPDPVRGVRRRESSPGDRDWSASDWKKQARILKVILYGSYARGGWVDEPHTAKGYQSDFDLLIIVNNEKLTDRIEFWSTAEDRLNRELAITKTLRTPVNFIVHTMHEVNDGLAHGRYFFMDIARDGIALYQSEDTEFHEPKPKTPQQALAMAREYFEEWYPSAQAFDMSANGLEKRGTERSRVHLHQTVERLYHCVLLVCTFYTPHVHNLGFLRTQAERIDPR